LVSAILIIKFAGDDKLIIVRATNLTIEYPDKTRAIKNISFNIENGESVALIGENGSGKTTLLLALAGAIKPASGTIELGGAAGMIFQNPDDQLFMPTIFDDAAFGVRNLGLEPVKEIAEKALAELNVLHLRDKSPFKLSGGEKRMAAIATVLAMSPDIILFDEPTAFLDNKSRLALTKTLLKLPQTKIIATHDEAFASQVCGGKIVLAEGRIVSKNKFEE
jgi:cobalt/nickel transport system ATP-binding protein